MSTNFYLGTEEKTEQYHLGKRSGGWSFLFRGRRDKKIVDFKSWFLAAKKLERKGYRLYNDNSDMAADMKDLLKVILSLVDKKPHTEIDSEASWQDDAGHCFYDGEFS